MWKQNYLFRGFLGSIATLSYTQICSWLDFPHFQISYLLSYFFLRIVTQCIAWFHIGAKQEVRYKFWIVVVSRSGLRFQLKSRASILIQRPYIHHLQLQSNPTSRNRKWWHKMVLYWSGLMDNVAWSSPLGGWEPACCRFCIQYINNGYYQQSETHARTYARTHTRTHARTHAHTHTIPNPLEVHIHIYGLPPPHKGHLTKIFLKPLFLPEIFLKPNTVIRRGVK